MWPRIKRSDSDFDAAYSKAHNSLSFSAVPLTSSTSARVTGMLYTSWMKVLKNCQIKSLMIIHSQKLQTSKMMNSSDSYDDNSRRWHPEVMLELWRLHNTFCLGGQLTYSPSSSSPATNSPFLFILIQKAAVTHLLKKASTKGTMDPEGSACNSCNSWPLYARCADIAGMLWLAVACTPGSMLIN